MADLLDFLPLFSEDVSTIRARMDADANSGLTVTDPRWVDIREGSFYWDVTQVVALELARLWDALAAEVPAAAFPIYAWGDYLDAHAELFGLVRKESVEASGEVTFLGDDGTLVATGTVVSTTAATEDAESIEFVTVEDGTITAGSVIIAVEAVEAGSAGNVAIGAITSIDTPNPGVDSIQNDVETTGGTDVESDEALRERILLELEGQGAGNASDYRRWALSRPGVGKVFVNPVWAGPGTVQVVVMTEDGAPVATDVITDVQNYLDPAGGSAEGQAPVGIAVTVQTPVQLPVIVVATITYVDGYSADGAGGTIEQRSVIEDALADYINGLDVGADVIYEHVKATIFQAEGVLNVAGVTVNGGTTDVAITVNPPQTASLTTPVTLS